MPGDLIDLSDDKDKPSSKPVSKPTSKSAAASIDLFKDDLAAASAGIPPCNSNFESKPPAKDDDDDDGILEVWGGATPLIVATPARKKRKVVLDPSMEVDAIDMTSAASLKEAPEDPFAEYKQKLGPLRMGFVSEDTFAQTHTFAKDKNSLRQIKMRKWHKELVEYQLNLPVTPQGSIFVRVHESRLDLVRVLITGPEGTPYQNGCFFFDFQMKDYPSSPPQGKLLTTGGGKVRFNPNLYNCGKICLSLLGTWEGPKWMPNKSTFLQVLVSIQGLILVPEPYYNEPGYERRKNDPQSRQYNQNIRRQTLKWAIEDPLQRSLDILDKMDSTGDASGTKGTGKRKSAKNSKAQMNGYPEFAVVVVRHFVQQAESIESQLDEWLTLDGSLKQQATRIRKLLRRAMQHSFDDVAQVATKASAAALKRASPSKKPPPPPDAEVIELL